MTPQNNTNMTTGQMPPQVQPMQPQMQAMPQATPVMKVADNKLLSALNAIGLGVAVYFGVMAIFGAIAGFAKIAWNMKTDEVSLFLLGGGNLNLAMALTAVLGAVVAMLTIKKITDAEILKNAYRGLMVGFLMLAGMAAVGMLATALYSLMGIGAKYVSQGSLWGIDFVVALVKFLAAVTVVVIAQNVVKGKIQMLKMANFAGLGIAGLGLVLVVISVLIGFYSKSGTGLPKSSGTDSLDSWKSLFEAYK